MASFFACLLFLVAIGFGALFEEPLDGIFAVDPQHASTALLVPMMWACAAAALEHTVAAAWLARRQR